MLSAPLALLLFAAACDSSPRYPNIFLITADTLRADHLSSRGYPRATTPALDAFAENAWDFRNAITVIPKTGPSLTTMFTGWHPEEHKVRSNFEAIPSSIVTLAQRLQASGYYTAAFVGNEVLRGHKGYARGFDLYQLQILGDGVNEVWEAFEAWTAQPNREPVFVWLHFLDPHGPYSPTREFEDLFIADEWAQSDARVSLKPVNQAADNANKVLGAIPRYQIRSGEDRVAAYVARYDAEIRYMDTAFARVLDRLRGLGLYDDSVIVFTSDHGESLGEHDFYFEHGWFAYDASLRIPLLIKQPHQSKGRRVSEQVTNLDFLPTLLSLAGQPPAAGLAGRDLLGPLQAGEPVLIQNSNRYPEKYYGARDGSWKYLVNIRNGVEELYDLRADPAETRNVLEREPEVAQRLRGRLEGGMKALISKGVIAPEMGEADDEETLRRLRALGYAE
jgi:arylsulfatase A-like enzyme